MEADKLLGDPVFKRARCTQCGEPNIIYGAIRGWRYFLRRAMHVCEKCWRRVRGA